MEDCAVKVQAIAFDLDDTLLRDDRAISDYTCRVLRKAADRGIIVIPASGRTGRSMHGFVERIGCAACFVCANGAEVRDSEGRVMMQELLSVEVAREAAAFAQRHGCYAQVYDEDRFYYSRQDHYADEYAASSSLPGTFVGDLTAFITRPTPKLLMMDDPARIAVMLREAGEQLTGRAAVTCSKPYFLEINPVRATKGNALQWCAAHFGFSMENLLAFGDSLNDLSMLTAAGRGVAMANAREDVKALIPARCLSNEQDGVADYIDKYVLREEQA